MHYCRPPFPEELELALMIIFAVFLRASEVGCFFWAADGTGYRVVCGGREEQRRKEGKEKAGR